AADARVPGRAERARRLGGPIDAGAHRTTAVARIEGGKLVASIAEHRDPEALEALDGEAQVEDDLRPGAEDRDRRARQLDQVRGLVFGVAAMDSADAPGGQEPYPGHGRRSHGGGDRRRPGRSASHRRPRAAGPYLPRAPAA